MSAETEVGARGKNLVGITTGVLGLVSLVAGGVYALEARYASQQEMQAQIRLVEEKTVKTFDDLSKNLDQKFRQYRYDSAVDERYKLKNYLRVNPNDEEARQDLHTLEGRIEEMRRQLEKTP
jgi:hypothetical protein